ncbi:MAG TPA: PQQ-dependent sugar dehydrogenase [Solirubrobacterales bacterium]|nr:PQQ-dependent sugar dehydrogenase [Solirubrobacterales bacterium]
MSTLVRAAGKIGIVAMLLAGLWCASAQALSLQPVGSGFEEPMYLTSDPSDPDHLFVVEREGRVRLLENGSSTLFADVSSLVDCCGSERGLQSIALSPDFATSGRLFVLYSGKEEPGEIHVAEMRAVGGSALASIPRNLLTIPHPDGTHYGGQLQFGPEGNLFVSTGDGGGADDPSGNAQNLESRLGKILRIDPDAEGLQPYGIPPGNPFAGTPGAKPEIWSLGLRNPYRFSFDRQTGDVWIGDVGQAAREEVDFAAAPGLGGGANYGWNCREGLLAGPEAGCAGDPGFVDPVFDYPNPEPGCAAIIGGYVARDASLGDSAGRYLYGDLCVGDIRSFLPSDPFGTDRYEGVHVDNLYSFGQDSCGRLYAVSGSGSIFRFVGPSNTDCPVQTGPQPPELKYSFIGVRALRSKVKRNRRAFITAFVSPCSGRRGQPVSLWQGRRKIGTRRLDRVCTVRFRPRIKHRVRFRAKVLSDGVYTEATSRLLKIRILRRHHR